MAPSRWRSSVPMGHHILLGAGANPVCRGMVIVGDQLVTRCQVPAIGATDGIGVPKPGGGMMYGALP